MLDERDYAMAEETGNNQVQNDWKDAFNPARLEATSGRTKTAKATKKNEQPTDEHKRIAEIADELSKPEYWDGLVRAPADYMLATTGHKHWDLPDRDVKKIAVPLAFSARSFISLDPRIMLLILLVSNIGTVYGPRVAQEFNIRKSEALDEVEKRDIKA